MTWTNLNTVDSGFDFDTDGSGAITFYGFYADLISGGDIDVYYAGPSQVTQLFVSNTPDNTSATASFQGQGASGGTWSVQSSVATPEPSSLLLLAIGLLACLSLLKKPAKLKLRGQCES